MRKVSFNLYEPPTQQNIDELFNKIKKISIHDLSIYYIEGKNGINFHTQQVLNNTIKIYFESKERFAITREVKNIYDIGILQSSLILGPHTLAHISYINGKVRIIYEDKIGSYQGLEFEPIITMIYEKNTKLNLNNILIESISTDNNCHLNKLPRPIFNHTMEYCLNDDEKMYFNNIFQFRELLNMNDDQEKTMNLVYILEVKPTMTNEGFLINKFDTVMNIYFHMISDIKISENKIEYRPVKAFFDYINTMSWRSAIDSNFYECRNLSHPTLEFEENRCRLTYTHNGGESPKLNLNANIVIERVKIYRVV